MGPQYLGPFPLSIPPLVGEDQEKGFQAVEKTIDLVLADHVAIVHLPESSKVLESGQSTNLKKKMFRKYDRRLLAPDLRPLSFGGVPSCGSEYRNT
jgi:hypothetical protein